LSDWEHGISQITLTIDGPYEAVAHYVPTPAWWNNVQIILALAGVLTASFVGAAWITTRRRKGVMKPLPEPTATKLPKVVLPGRIITGYEDLDDLLFGGIPENYAVALTSISCDERDLLIKRFLEVGIRKGEVAFYVAANLGEVRSLVQEFQSGFYAFICNPRADTMIESLPNVFKLNGVENLTEINIALTKAFRALDTSPKGPRRACIEILSDVLLQHHAVQTRRWLADLIPDLRSRGFTTLAAMNPQMHSSQEVQAILDLFDGEINILEREPQKLLKIKKMVNQKYLDSELPIRKERLEG
jgi:KaiC/GvpD/RAD55 family RecA-like ATPase